VKKGRRGLRRRIAGLTTLAVAALIIVPIALAGAISSTTNPAVDNPTGTTTLCQNGGAGANNPPGAVNCNIYTAKQYVWLSGLPDSADLGPGTYYFAVLDPGGQRNPNDGTGGNLSDDTDPYTNRIFTIALNGDLSTLGTHDVAGNRIRVGVSPAVVSGGPDWFKDTDNNGGVYILAVCALPNPIADSPGVNPKDCKYDAFKISESPTTPPSADLGVTKSASATFTRDYDWSVLKDQTTSSTPINSGDSSVTVAYQVKATWSGPTDTYGVGGTIHVNNPNSYDVTGVAVSDDVINETADTCSVDDGSYTDGSGTHSVSHSNGTIPAGVTVDYLYSCVYSAAPVANDETNRATATWDASNALPDASGTGDANFSFPSPTVTHDTTTVTDTFNGGATDTLGVADVNGNFTKDLGNTLDNWGVPSYDLGTKTFTFTYTRSVSVVRGACTKYDNTATVSNDATSTDNSDGASVTVCGPLDLGVTKGAAATFTRDYDWSVIKDQTTRSSPINVIGSSVTVAYRITATWSGSTDTYGVSGTIHVSNPNSSNVTGIGDVTGVAVTDDILNDTADACTVQDGSYTDGSGTHSVSHTNGTIPAGVTVDYLYVCTYSAAPASTNETNRATATWAASNNTPNTSKTGDATFSFPSPTVTHDTTTVKDAFNGGAALTLGVANVNGTFTKDAGNNLAGFVSSYSSGTKTFTFTYTRTVSVVRSACTTYNNTATVSDDSTNGDNSDGASVTVCGTANTGALTMGFWKNANGQGLISGYCNNALGAYLAGLGGGSGPFSNAPTSCSALATYVANILNAASATNMNLMLKAQMLASALDVWFSGVGWTATKSGSLKPPSSFLQHNSLGTFKMNTTAICPMVDNLSTGSASCTNNTPSTDAVAAGAVPLSPMSMQAILDFAATTLVPFNGSTSSPIWYAGNRTKQEILKNIFDQFNNQLAFGSF
jgi:hypothetical protein